MNRFENAVADLIAAAGPGEDTVEEAYACAQRLLAELETADAAAQQRALAGLADVLPTAPLACAGVVALACGALVENGGDPERPLDGLLARLPEALAGAAAFADACRDRAKNGPAADEDAGDPVERFGDDVTETMPAEAVAWGALELIGMAFIAVLSRSPDARGRVRARPELLRQAQTVADLHDRAKFLAEMLRVLDDEDFLVLHPESGRGWKVRIRGVSDNFQMHTLLTDALIGDPEKGLLPGRCPDPRVVAAARDRPVDPAALLAEGAFNLMNWQALRPDMTLPTGQEGSAHWIWNEGVPADIERFEGVRVVLLGPPPYHRTWNADRRFGDMPADLRVVETLTPAAATGWLNRIAAAPRSAGDVSPAGPGG
jgi:hypothetical protein